LTQFCVCQHGLHLYSSSRSWAPFSQCGVSWAPADQPIYNHRPTECVIDRTNKFVIQLVSVTVSAAGVHNCHIAFKKALWLIDEQGDIKRWRGGGGGAPSITSNMRITLTVHGCCARQFLPLLSWALNSQLYRYTSAHCSHWSHLTLDKHPPCCQQHPSTN
jgi:hypothetical protein